MPLGPGYVIERESLEIRYDSSSVRARLRAAYRLKNTGNRELSSIEVALPDRKLFGREALRVHVEERELMPQAPADAQAASIEIPLNPPWPQKEKLELAIEYDLAPQQPGNPAIGVNQDSFHLRAHGCFPRLLAPEAFFVAGGERPDKVRVTLNLPADFRVVSAGSRERRRPRGGESEHRFRLRGEDGEPFVVAGRYHEQEVASRDATVVFWTFAPLDAQQAQRAGARIAAAIKMYATTFGLPVPGKQRRGVWLVETHARLARSAGEADGPAGSAFPDGALLNRQAFALGLDSDSFLALAEHELAHTRFGLSVAARPEAEVVLSEGLAEYATIVAAEARGGEAARRHGVALALGWYDEARQHVAEKPLVSLGPADPWEQRRLGYSRGALLFVALEDEIGKAPVRAALARLVRAFPGERAAAGGGHAGYHELRAALESETGRPLADFFRIWLNQTGIPDQFRARYSVARDPAK